MQSTLEVPLKQAPPAAAVSPINSWQRYVNRLLAKELSRMTRYFDCVYQWLPRRSDSRGVLANIDATGELKQVSFGTAMGDTMQFYGFGTAAQGATFTQVGTTSQWQIHSGLDNHNEIITLIGSNSSSVHPSDYTFFA